MTPNPRLLARRLDRLYDDFNRAGHPEDPVQIVRRFEDVADREIVGFCASALAFGRVASALGSIEALISAMGTSPARFVRQFEARRDAGRLDGLGHRWIRSGDLVALVRVLQRLVVEHGSLERAVAAGLPPDASDVTDALESFSSRALDPPASARARRRATGPGVAYFFSRPSSGSACKRLNLFLRWMVRCDAVDPGGWTLVRPAQLVVPLDTHVIRVGQCLRLTRYRSPGWRMAADITASLRRLSPDDPVKYDFSLCHLGMMNACGFSRPQGDARCPLRGFCRPTAGRRRASRPPSWPR
jgi:uncharacterized protein (TIGR02757 family)